MDTKTPTHILQTVDLRKSFPVGQASVEVLKGININVKQGDFAVIFGPSGCGKSTLLHTLLGLEQPTLGQVLVEGNDFYLGDDDTRAQYRRHKVGMIYQQPLWIKSFTVLDNLMFPLYMLDVERTIIWQKAISALKTVGMEQWAEYMPSELSSGQQQKISLARALMISPVLIVADEPTGNLDTVSGQELIRTFVELTQQGRTIVMVTHDLEYLKYATKIFHMVDGEVVEELEPTGNKSALDLISGKRGYAAGNAEPNVRDRDYLKNLFKGELKGKTETSRKQKVNTAIEKPVEPSVETPTPSVPDLQPEAPTNGLTPMSKAEAESTTIQPKDSRENSEPVDQPVATEIPGVAEKKSLEEVPVTVQSDLKKAATKSSVIPPVNGVVTPPEITAPKKGLFSKFFKTKTS